MFLVARQFGRQGQGEWVEHKDAKNVIHDSSARHVHVPGRFAYHPTLPSP
ncbi:hypothetical protein [Erwinia sp. E_sp_B04_7]